MTIRAASSSAAIDAAGFPDSSPDDDVNYITDPTVEHDEYEHDDDDHDRDSDDDDSDYDSVQDEGLRHELREADAAFAAGRGAGAGAGAAGGGAVTDEEEYVSFPSLRRSNSRDNMTERDDAYIPDSLRALWSSAAAAASVGAVAVDGGRRISAAIRNTVGESLRGLGGSSGHHEDGGGGYWDDDDRECGFYPYPADYGVPGQPRSSQQESSAVRIISAARRAVAKARYRRRDGGGGRSASERHFEDEEDDFASTEADSDWIELIGDRGGGRRGGRGGYRGMSRKELREKYGAPPPYYGLDSDGEGRGSRGRRHEADGAAGGGRAASWYGDLDEETDYPHHHHHRHSTNHLRRTSTPDPYGIPPPEGDEMYLDCISLSSHNNKGSSPTSTGGGGYAYFGGHTGLERYCCGSSEDDPSYEEKRRRAIGLFLLMAILIILGVALDAKDAVEEFESYAESWIEGVEAPHEYHHRYGNHSSGVWTAPLSPPVPPSDLAEVCSSGSFPSFFSSAAERKRREECKDVCSEAECCFAPWWYPMSCRKREGSDVGEEDDEHCETYRKFCVGMDERR